MWRVLCGWLIGFLVLGSPWVALAQQAPAVEPSAVEPPAPVEAAPPSHTNRNTAVVVSGSAVMLTSGPLLLLAMDRELSPGGALQVSAGSLLGSATLASGGLLLVGSAGLLLLGSIWTFFDPEEGGGLLLASAVTAGAGLGLFVAAPWVFRGVTHGVDGRLGGEPESPLAVSSMTVLGGGAGGLLAWWLVEDVETAWWAKALLVFSSMTLAANLTYGLLRLGEERQEAPAARVLSPLLVF